MSSESGTEPKKKESLRSVVIVAVLCGAFLWWWFNLDTTPEEVGPEGLADRALAELKERNLPRPIVMDFDLLELSMCWLRAGKPDEATKLAEQISNPILHARALRAIAQGYLGVLAKDATSMGPALKTVAKISDKPLQEAARDSILLDLVRMGFADIAWEQQPSPSLQAKILRVMSETDAQEAAAARLAKLEPDLLKDASPSTLEEIAMTHLWLGHEDRVLELAPKLPLKAQDEIYAELFRMTRLQTPDKARPLLEKIPARLQLACRLEAAKLNGTLETPDQLVAEAQAAADASAAAPTDQALEKWMFLTRAQWQLLKPTPDAWKSSAAKVETFLPNVSVETRIKTALKLSQIFYDALDLTNGHRLLEIARQSAMKADSATNRLVQLAPVIDAAFHSGEADYVQLLLIDLTPDLNTPGVIAGFTDSGALREILVALFREGNWTQVMKSLEQVPAALLPGALSALADLPVEATAGQGFAVSQDKSMQAIRQVATSQGETEAAKLAMQKAAGAERGRAWLEMAKGLILKSVLDSESTAPPPPQTPTE